MTVVLSRKGGAGTGGTGTAQALSIGVSTGGNTAGNTTVNSGSRFVIVGSNGITASQGTGAGATTVTLSGITQTVQTQGVLSMGVSTGGNTAGNTTVNTGSRFVLVASGDATASQATAAGATTVTLSVGTQSVQTQGVLSAGVSTGGNTSGDTTVNTGSQFVLVGSNLTLSQGTAAGATTITISGPAAAAGAGSMSMWPSIPVSIAPGVALGVASFTSAATRTTMSAIVWPIAIDQFVSANYMRLPVAVSMTSATTNTHWNFTGGHSLGIYTLTGNTLSLLSSFSNNQVLTHSTAANSTNASATWSMSYGSGTDLSSSRSLSTNNAAGNFYTQISSTKWHPFASGAFSLSAGQYFGAWAFSSSTAGANLASISGVGVQGFGGSANTLLDIGISTGSTFAQYPLAGMVSMTQTNTGMPDSILTANISTGSGAAANINRNLALQMISSM